MTKKKISKVTKSPVLGDFLPKKKHPKSPTGDFYKAIVLDPNHKVTILPPKIEDDLKAYDRLLDKQLTQEETDVMDKAAANQKKMSEIIKDWKGEHTVSTKKFNKAMIEHAYGPLEVKKGDHLHLEVETKGLKLPETAGCVDGLIKGSYPAKMEQDHLDALAVQAGKAVDKKMMESLTENSEPGALPGDISPGFSASAMKKAIKALKAYSKKHPTGKIIPNGPPRGWQAQHMMEPLPDKPLTFKLTVLPKGVSITIAESLQKAYKTYGLKMDTKCPKCQEEFQCGEGVSLSHLLQATLGSPPTVEDVEYEKYKAMKKALIYGNYYGAGKGPVQAMSIDWADPADPLAGTKNVLYPTHKNAAGCDEPEG